MFRSGTAAYRMAWGLALLCAALCPAAAQPDDEEDRLSHDRLINLDTPATPARGVLTFRGDLRIFGAEEDLTYGTLQLGYGLRDNLQLMLRAGVAGEKDFTGPGFTIRHGGTDVELLAKWRPPNYPYWALALGVSIPSTPAQNGVNLTTQLLYQRPLGSNVIVSFVPKAVFVKDNPIVGIGGGMSVRLNDMVEVVGDITGIVSGNNTRSVLTGDRIRGEVWGVALRFAPRAASHGLTVDLGVTNGTGGTTGLSVTPGLSGSAAIYLSLTWRR
jgi:hypothetical protein